MGRSPLSLQVRRFMTFSHEPALSEWWCEALKRTGDEEKRGEQLKTRLF